MSATDWLLSTSFGVICVLALLGLPKLWRHETKYWDGRAPGWWVWGEALYRGWVRALVAGTFAAVSLLLAFVVGNLGGLDSDGDVGVVTDVSFGVLALLAVVSSLLVVTVVTFNWPKLVVPPHLRRERGAVAQWRTNRNRRARSN